MKINSNINEPENNSFNKVKYIKSLKDLNYITYNEYIDKKHKQMKKDFPLIKEIIYLIIEYTVDAYYLLNF